MNRNRLLQDAKVIESQLKEKKHKNVNPYASFATQMIGLIQNGKVAGKDDILRLMDCSYSRPGMNRQWRTFNSVLAKNIKSNLDTGSLIYLLGYLKRLLTIEGKKQDEERKEYQKKDKHFAHRGGKQGYRPRNKH